MVDYLIGVTKKSKFLPFRSTGLTYRMRLGKTTLKVLGEKKLKKDFANRFDLKNVKILKGRK